MNKKWLFLRGEWDERTQKSIDDNDDVWLQLFSEITGEKNYSTVFFKDVGSIDLKNRKLNCEAKHNKNIDIISSTIEEFSKWFNLQHINYMFVRGGFLWQEIIAKGLPNAYKIYYGAGRRYVPKEDIYNLILCDSEKHKTEILQRYPKSNPQLFIKPAAKHFKPIDCKKEYDVLFIANETQGHFKGIQWVYNTVPKDLKVLHLGNFTGQYKAPENVTRKHVDRIDMAKEISKCKIGIVPYWNQIDSCPRIIPEMIACGLPLVVADELNFWNEKYKTTLCNKQDFWEKGIEVLGTINSIEAISKGCVKNVITKDYERNLSLPIAAKHIHKLIKESIN